MIIENLEYPGKGKLLLFCICICLIPILLVGLFWANDERLSYLSRYNEMKERPEYPYDLYLQEQAAQQQQQADFHRTIAFGVFCLLLGVTFIGFYSFYILKTNQIWKKEWEWLRYYLMIISLWVFAVILIIASLLMLGIIVEN